MFIPNKTDDVGIDPPHAHVHVQSLRGKHTKSHNTEGSPNATEPTVCAGAVAHTITG